MPKIELAFQNELVTLSRKKTEDTVEALDTNFVYGSAAEDRFQ